MGWRGPLPLKLSRSAAQDGSLRDKRPLMDQDQACKGQSERRALGPLPPSSIYSLVSVAVLVALLITAFVSVPTITCYICRFPPAMPHGEIVDSRPRVRVYVDPEGSRYWVQEERDPTLDLASSLAAQYRKHRGDLRLEIHAVEMVPYGRILDVVDAARQAGIQEVLLLGRREKWRPTRPAAEQDVVR